jgi:hypothetical protein
MTRFDFYTLCEKHAIAPEVALENPKIREALKKQKEAFDRRKTATPFEVEQSDIKEIDNILKEEF